MLGGGGGGFGGAGAQSLARSRDLSQLSIGDQSQSEGNNNMVAGQVFVGGIAAAGGTGGKGQEDEGDQMS